MTIQFVQEGASIDYTPDADVGAGVGVIQKYLFGITKAFIKGGELGALAIEGIYDIPKSTDPGAEFEAGDYVLFDETLQIAKPLSMGGDILIGRAVADAAEAATEVQVKLLV